MAKTLAGEEPPWPGFYAPRYTQVPDELFDYWLPRLSEAELKVLLYIIRRTFGFKKDADAISLSQLSSGIVKADGTRLDWGAGVAERSVLRALPKLLGRGLIEAEKRTSPDGSAATTVYRLRLRPSPQIAGTPPQRAGTLSDKLSAPVPAESRTQDTVQETEQQEDDQPAPPITNEGAAPRYSAYIAAVMLDHAGELGAAPRGPAGVTEALRLWAASGLSERAFVERLHQARAAVRKQQGPGADKWTLYLAALHAADTAPPAPRLKHYYNE